MASQHSPQPLVMKGLALFARGDFQGAARAWLEAIAGDPKNPQLGAYLRQVEKVSPKDFAEAKAGAPTVPPSSVGPPATAKTMNLPPALHPSAADFTVDPWSGDGEQEGFELPANEAPAPGFDVVKSSSTAPVLLSVPPPKNNVAPSHSTKSEEIAEDIDTLEATLVDLLKLDDFSGALTVADKILAQKPNHQAAFDAHEKAVEALTKMFESKIGNRERVPKVLMSPDELIWLDLDHRSGYVLSQVDGVSSFDEIIEVLGMERLEVCRLLVKLLQCRAIG